MNYGKKRSHGERDIKMCCDVSSPPQGSCDTHGLRLGKRPGTNDGAASPQRPGLAPTAIRLLSDPSELPAACRATDDSYRGRARRISKRYLAFILSREIKLTPIDSDGR